MADNKLPVIRIYPGVKEKLEKRVAEKKKTIEGRNTSIAQEASRLIDKGLDLEEREREIESGR